MRPEQKRLQRNPSMVPVKTAGGRAFLALGAAILIALASWGLRSHRAATERLTEPIKKGPIVQSVYGIGTVTANKTFQLKPGTTLTVRRLYVKEGDHVERGEKMVDLESASFAAPFS